MSFLIVLVLGLAATGCVSLPATGPVLSTDVQEVVEGDTLIDYTPAGPRPGADPVALTDAFLTSMTATPLTTHVARQFLTTSARRTWVPERGTVVYGGLDLISGPGGPEGAVQVVLRDVVELDDRGTWLGDPTDGRGHDYRLRLVRQDGQWRILDLPDRLLVPRSHFDTQYQQALIYFFDRSAQVLVPEPVYVPRGRQAPTMMVSALLKGPEPYLRGVEQTFFPDGTRLDGISVPVSGAGTAEVPLSPQVLEAGDRQLRLLSAQLAWTLGQVPSVERVRVTVADTQVDLPGNGKDVSVDAWSRYDPAVASASTDLFGLRRGRLVSVGPAGGRQRVGGPFGAMVLGLRSVALDLPAQRTAGVTLDGRRVLEAGRDAAPGSDPPSADVRTVLTGTDLATPSYDLHGRLWLLDRTSSGARLAVRRDGEPQVVTAPGLSGADVRAVALSRDGTRVASLVARGGRLRVLLSRVERDADGGVRRIGPARRLPLDDAAGAAVAIAWRTPDRVAVLVTPTPTTSQVVLVTVDGSRTTPLVGDLEPLAAVGSRVVAAPSPGTPLWVQTPGGGMFGLSRSGDWVLSQQGTGLVAATYVG